MNRHLYKKRSKKAGLPPGSLVPITDKPASGPTRITLIEYNDQALTEREIQHLSDGLPLKPAPAVSWINVDSVHDPVLLEEFGKAFGLHPLILEDILNTDQRPKFEAHENVLFVVLKVFNFNEQTRLVLSEQISLVVGSNYVLSFQEEIGNEFDAVRERLKANHTKLRKLGSDYLAYTLIDTIVDHYFGVLEKLGECLEVLELNISATHRHGNILQEIHTLRRELILLRKSIWPLREVVNAMLRTDSLLIDENVKPYLRDVYDHTIQVIDSIETYRDILGGLQDLYLSVLSNRMNEIMKVLTIISTLFIPVTFVVGIYGMNFKYMPELNSPWGYPVVMAFLLAVIVLELVFFKRKGWF